LNREEQSGNRTHSRQPELDSGSHKCSLERLLRFLNLFQPKRPMSRKDVKLGNLAHCSQFTAHSPAFTLAEVLITLGVIGVVAAMTIPILINSIEENQYHVGLKKYYGILTEVVTKAKLENSTDDLYPICSSYTPYTINAVNCVRDVFKPHLKVAKSCDNSQSGCLSSYGIYYLDNSGTNYPLPIGVLYLNDGTIIRFWMANIQSYAIILDVNGQKEPNTYGKDVYYFTYANNKLSPNYPGNANITNSCPGTDGLNCAGYYLMNH
jgi:prepilin-type N-terminal cleavage/methylation domain-containing protein